MRRLLAAAIVLATLIPQASAAEFAVGAEFSVPDLPVSDGGASVLHSRIASFASSRYAAINHSDAQDLLSATQDIEDSGVTNATSIRAALASSSGVASLFETAIEQARQREHPAGVLTNVTRANSPTGLTDGTIALYEELGWTMSATEKLAIQAQVAQAPPNAALAGSLMVWATLDAKHYLERAYGNVNESAWETIRGNEQNLSLIHRRISTEWVDGEALISMSAEQADLLDAAAAFVASIDEDALAQAGDVLLQAIDQVKALPQNVPPGTVRNYECSPVPLIFASQNCLILIGDSGPTPYNNMNYGSTREKNIILIDFGGSDTYQHRAGGGFAPDPVARLGSLAGCTTPTSADSPGCYLNVQVLLDLGTGSDTYTSHAGAGFPQGPAHGSGLYGVGILYDQGGSNHISSLARRPSPLLGQFPMLMQGAGFAGIGLLIQDGSGSDRYEARNSLTDQPFHAQGAGILGGVGLMYDAGGADERYFNITPRLVNGVTIPVDGGGSQGYASTLGLGYLIDRGSGDDHYSASQDLNQAAADLGGFAMLWDEGGANTFLVASGLGCAVLLYGPETCPGNASYVPIAGWSQGYAGLLGVAILHAGVGHDAYVITIYDPTNETLTRSSENVHRVATAGAGGVAIFYDPAGSDHYRASSQSTGFAKAGLAIFSDRGGDDHYHCAQVSCMGYGEMDGLGVFYDGVSGGDIFDNLRVDGTRSQVWSQIPGAGLGAHIAPGEMCSCSPDPTEVDAFDVFSLE